MKPKRQVVGQPRPGALLDGLAVEHQEERPLRARVEGGREHDALVLAVGVGRGDENRLLGVDAVELLRRRARLHVDLHEAVLALAEGGLAVCVPVGPEPGARRHAGTELTRVSDRKSVV